MPEIECRRKEAEEFLYLDGFWLPNSLYLNYLSFSKRKNVTISRPF